MTDKLKFKLAKKITLGEIERGEPIQSADYTFVHEATQSIYQFDIIEEETNRITFKMKPGIFKLEYENNALVANPMATQNVDFLETSGVHEEIVKQIDAFYNNLHIYKKLKIEHPKRGLLLYSDVGIGKSSSITRVSKEYSQNKSACVFIWPSDSVKVNDLESFLEKNCDWSESEKFILVVEDLGGSADMYGVVNAKVPASLLNFLDGIGSVFKKPTFIIATTNNPSAMLDSITSRPGRFDAVIELKAPNRTDRLRFLKFFAREDYNLSSHDEKTLLDLTDGFSVAYLKEVYFRAMLLQRTMLETAKELKEHKAKVKANFAKTPAGGSVGFGGAVADWDD